MALKDKWGGSRGIPNLPHEQWRQFTKRFRNEELTLYGQFFCSNFARIKSIAPNGDTRIWPISIFKPNYEDKDLAEDPSRGVRGSEYLRLPTCYPSNPSQRVMDYVSTVVEIFKVVWPELVNTYEYYLRFYPDLLNAEDRDNFTQTKRIMYKHNKEAIDKATKNFIDECNYYSYNSFTHKKHYFLTMQDALKRLSISEQDFNNILTGKREVIPGLRIYEINQKERNDYEY